MLQALFQAMGREGTKLHEVEILKTSLLRSCTPEGQTALTQDIHTLLDKQTMLKKSIHKQLDHLQCQKAGEMGADVSITDPVIPEGMGRLQRTLPLN